MAGREVDVWVIRLAPVLASRCTEEEVARAAAFGSGVAADRWLAARGALRAVLGRVAETRPELLRFTEGPAGKPALVGRPDIEFNASHAGGAVAVAVSSGPVGIDIEAGRRLVSPARLARRLFDADGLEEWMRAPEPHRTRMVLQAWTRVEAMLKAEGTGIAGGTRTAIARLSNEGWRVRDLAVQPLIGAIAGRGEDWVVRGPRWQDADQCVV